MRSSHSTFFPHQGERPRWIQYDTDTRLAKLLREEMRFGATHDSQLDRSSLGVFHLFLEQNETCNDVGPMRLHNQRNFALERRRRKRKDIYSFKLTLVTFSNHSFDSPSRGRSSSRLRSAIWVLTLGPGKNCSTVIWSPVTSCRTAPRSSLCAAPNENDTPKPPTTPNAVGATIADVTPARYASLSVD